MWTCIVSLVRRPVRAEETDEQQLAGDHLQHHEQNAGTHRPFERGAQDPHVDREGPDEDRESDQRDRKERGGIVAEMTDEPDARDPERRDDGLVAEHRTGRLQVALGLVQDPEQRPVPGEREHHIDDEMREPGPRDRRQDGAHQEVDQEIGRRAQRENGHGGREIFGSAAQQRDVGKEPQQLGHPATPGRRCFRYVPGPRIMPIDCT
jgi:hypothetical protein